jgi:hypothetical protein
MGTKKWRKCCSLLLNSKSAYAFRRVVHVHHAAIDISRVLVPYIRNCLALCMVTLSGVELTVDSSCVWTCTSLTRMGVGGTCTYLTRMGVGGLEIYLMIVSCIRRSDFV